MRRLSALCFLAFIFSFAAPAAGQAPSGAASVLQVENAPRPGDLIRLQIWREPEMSGQFPVDENGTVVLPRLGPMQVSSETPRTLAEKLVAAYARFLNHSSIDVAVLRRIQVLGAVRSPGLYNVDATMTVADALALAGGALPEVSPERVQLVRNGQRMDVRLSGDSRLANLQMRSGDQLYVPERSWINRNSGLVAAGLTASVSLIIALFTR